MIRIESPSDLEFRACAWFANIIKNRTQSGSRDSDKQSITRPPIHHPLALIQSIHMILQSVIHLPEVEGAGEFLEAIRAHSLDVGRYSMFRVS